jgi:hypothetical protein
MKGYHAVMKHSLTLAFYLIGLSFGTAADKWSVKMNVAHTCCCNAICPCLVGSPATRGYCHGNFLIDVKRGEYNGVRLNGVTLAITEEMRKWRRYYISDKATPQQADAVVALFGQLPLFAAGEVRSIERVPLKVNRTANRIAFSTPVSEVEIEPLKGKGGKLVTVENTPLTDFVQYKSISYHGKDLQFDYSGTHAGTWIVQASSQDRKAKSQY